MNEPRKDATGPLARSLWSRHANPASVRSLVAAYLALIWALYRRDRSLLVGTLLFVLANPLVFSPPDDDGAWETRVVLGERAWLEHGIGSSPADAALVALAAPVHLYALRAAVRGRPIATASGTALSVALMLLFFERMAQLYDRRAA